MAPDVPHLGGVQPVGVTVAEWHLEGIPTAVLQAELARRQPKVLILPGLVVDTVNHCIEYQGQRHRLIGRCMQVVEILAAAHLRGQWRVPSREFAMRFMPSDDVESALYNLRATITYVNKRVPGLILLSAGYGGYGLNVAPAPLRAQEGESNG